jgi:hypothetical protein
MIPQDPILMALATINAETIRAFDWLADGIDRRVLVTFVPNPGNIGDAAINLACFDRRSFANRTLPPPRHR